MKNKSIYSSAYMFVVFLFLYAPIAVLIFFSFNESKSRTNFTGFTLDWYRELFQNEMILQSLMVTLIVAALSSVISTVLGTAASIGMYSMKRAPRSILMNLTFIPIINPEIVTGVSVLLLFTVLRSIFAVFGANFEMGIGTLVLSHVVFSVPYVILSVNPKLRQLDKSIYDAALDLGCDHRQALRKVVIPEIMPGIITGFLMALTYSIDDFVISYFTSGTAQNLSIAIFSMTRRKVSPEINALSTIIFVVVLSVLLIVNYKEIRKEKRA